MCGEKLLQEDQRVMKQYPQGKNEDKNNTIRRMTMRITTCITTLLFLVAFVTGPVLAQENIVYPTKGQSAQQMEKDKLECYSWAKGQTGFDPMVLPKATAPPPKPCHASNKRGSRPKRRVVMSLKN